MSGVDCSSVHRLDTKRLTEFAEIFGHHQRSQARSLQRAIGPSEVGHPCDRHLAYKLAGVPWIGTEPLKWAALLGTWAHGGAEEAMRDENARLGRERYLIEQRAEIGDDIVTSGRTDVFDIDFNEVIDWKFPGESSAAKSAKEPPVEYVVQLMLYGLGWHRMGRTPRTVRIVFLPRWSTNIMDGHEWVAEWSETIALDALSRLAIIQAQSNMVVGQLLDWTAIDADKSKCVFCPWLRRRNPGEPEADATGCHGYFQSNDWMGIETRDVTSMSSPGVIQREANTRDLASALFSAIEGCATPAALADLWRDHKAVWTQKHTAAAAERKAELSQNESGA